MKHEHGNTFETCVIFTSHLNNHIISMITTKVHLYIVTIYKYNVKDTFLSN